jgi:UDP-N-acetyl-D-glucosamine dehydrogenase
MATVLTQVKEVKKDLFENLSAKIKHKTAVVGIIGMGYVGLPNMVSKSKNGYQVIGFDVDANKVNMVNDGVSYIEDVRNGELSEAVMKRRLMATTDFSLLRQADVIIICVPTPIDEYKQPDLSYVKKATIQIVKYAKMGALAILESTTYPSTTEDIIVNALENKGFVIGRDFFVAYSPERIDPSNKIYNVDNTPRIVGGHTIYCTELAKDFIGGNVQIVSSTKVAEMSKVFENTFRYVNIALANELAMICNKMDMDVWEVIDASKTKPYGFMAFYPTAGVGGHCIPVDPYYLSWYAKKYNYNAQMIEMAGDINLRMNDYSIDRIVQILNLEGKTVMNSKIAILGASYKKDIGDVRESPIFRLYDSLNGMGANIDVYDNYVDSFSLNGYTIDVENVEYDKISDYDIVVLLTNHTYFDYSSIAMNANSIFDTRNSFEGVEMFKGRYYKI